MARKRDISAIAALATGTTLILATFIASFFAKEPSDREPPYRNEINGVIQTDRDGRRPRNLVVGYNYHLLERYAEDHGIGMKIGTARSSDSQLDSLRAGRIDLLAVPFEAGLSFDSLIVSRPIDSLSVWLMRAEDSAEMERIDAWLEKWQEHEDYEQTRDNYLRRFNAFRSRQRETLSPYDDIIKANADSLGWDWRMLAALIYQESHFHIEAVSRRGASGLMQIMPATARRYGVEDPLDPESNIEAGARLLGRLMGRYHKVAADESEKFKFALAAYNAGIGRIADAIRLARHMDVDPAYWSNIAEMVIPEMSDTTALDSTVVKLGAFKGNETVAYVESVMAVYDEFLRICPSQTPSPSKEL